jgi:murein DD-endopeptidase MepM/ murein hydrolase activator NlpD
LFFRNKGDFKQKLKRQPVVKFLLSVGKKEETHKGLHSWDPYEYISVAIGVILVCVIAGWWIGNTFLAPSKSDNQYAAGTEPMDSDASDNTLHVSPLTIDQLSPQDNNVSSNSAKVQVSTYVVEPGETLKSIAQKYNITPDTLASANPKYALSKSLSGVILRIPSQDGLFYKVESGKTIERIAKQFSVQVYKIREANGLDESQSLAKNQELFIPDAKPNTTLLASQSGFGWPVKGEVTSGFGYRQHPMGGGTRFHRGVDIAAELGTPIYAAQSGHIEHADWYGLMGKCVIIQHANDYSTYYAHCSRIVAEQGQWVKKGQLIAYVGSTGLSTGPHVHFEVRRNDVPLNPMRFLP